MSKHEGDTLARDESTYERVMRRRQEEYDAIPQRGEHRLIDAWAGVRRTYSDGQLVRCESIYNDFLDLYSYDPDSGELSVEKHCRLTGNNLAPELRAVFHAAAERGKAEVAIKSMGGFLNLDVRVVKPNRHQSGSQPELEIKACYRGAAPPGSHDSRIGGGEEGDGRVKMWANPYWNLEEMSFSGCEHDPQTGLMSAEFEFENKRLTSSGRAQRGRRKEYARDSEGRVVQTKEYSYAGGCLWRIDVVSCDPSSGDVLGSEIVIIERGDLISLWDDQPRKWVRWFDAGSSSNEPQRQEWQPLGEEDLAVFEAPQLPRLSEYADVLPAIDHVALKQEFDAMAEELLRLENSDRLQVSG